MFEKLIEMDGQLLLWIQEKLRFDALTPFVKAITHSADGGTIMIIATLILMIIPKTRKLGFLCGAALVVNTLICNVILKNLVARVRPYEVVDGLKLIIGRQNDWSFPSGHSSAGFSMSTVLFRETPRKIGIPVLIFALLISLSRLYVGVHYPTDVICGIILGTLTGFFTCTVYHRAIAKNQIRLHRAEPVTQK